MFVRVLYFDGCPNFRPTFALVSQTLKELGIETSPVALEIRNESEARNAHFLGSPTVQVDGVDIEAARRNDEPVYGCRIYNHGTEQSGVPSRHMIAAAIQEQLAQE